MSDARYIDQEAGLKRLRGNRKLYARTLELFLHSTEFEEFEQALAAGDRAQAANVAHAIKGLSGNMSLTMVFETSTRLMEQLRKGEPDPQLLESYRAGLAETRVQAKALIAQLQAEA